MKPQVWPCCEPLPAGQTGKRLCQTFDYTWNAILKSNEATANWATVTKYPLKPRVLWRFHQDAEYIVGVRFDHITHYCLLDIDIESQYHPQRNKEGIKQIRRALESIGLCRVVCTRSSWSGGIHLWVPLGAGVPSFWLAVALKACLESHGLEVKQGQLETFPNCKTYAKPGEYSDYQGHRLPLQPASGSVLLNEAMEPQPGGLTEFFAQWDWAAAGQDLPLLIEAIALAKVIRTHRRYRKGSAVVAEWRRDLETEITEGWTAHGQTNHLLKTIACYGVVFQSLQGERLQNYVLTTAEQLPGYTQWCRHQHEIKARAHDWSNIAESYYWALGTQGTRRHAYHTEAINTIVPFNGNQQRSADAQQRIQAAVTQLQATQALPNGVRQRMEALARVGKCSNQTLNKYKELWHPDCWQSNSHGTNTATAQGSVCNGDPEGDRGPLAPEPQKQPNGSNTDQIDMLHTLPPLMKGCSAVTAPALKTQKDPPAVLIPTAEEKQEKREQQQSALPSDAAPQETPATTTTVTPAPAPAPTTTEPVQPRAKGAKAWDKPKQAPESVKTPPRQAQPSPRPGAAQPTTNQVLPQQGGHPPSKDSARVPSQSDRALTRLGSLLSHWPLRATPATPTRGAPCGNSDHDTAIRLPSDPLPAANRPGDPPPTVTTPTRKRRQQPKSGIDPHTLPPHAEYIAPPRTQLAIAPGTVLAVTNAVRDLLKQLQTECQWTTETVQAWIAQHFNGRRRSQLQDAELPLLLEKLQEQWQKMSLSGSSTDHEQPTAEEA